MSLNFAPPPRRVPLSLAIVNMCGAPAQIGWLVFGFGMIFVWLFAGHADYPLLDFRGAHLLTKGTIENSWPTSYSENKQNIKANAYEYSVAGKTFRGLSYATGRQLSPGDTTYVEYLVSNPAISRIAGMRRQPFGWGVLFTAIFPAIGIGFLAFGLRRGFRENDLLRHGILTSGKLKEQVATNMTVNRRRVMKLTFEFTARDGRHYETSVFSSQPERLTDEALEPLLYDPDEPSKAFVLDEAPARPGLDGTGELTGRPVAAAAALIIPAIVLIGNGLAALSILS